ncbi:DUF5342 family protein [Mangrovibacillus cuniculi]|uniref:YheE family protein n=1 Tax=Mangrovibacillus cuniculi TaxID=2593652 RepID=A0A7S8HEQ5_9BACI|nr:DUF5342 family protein [Mangrovibacillus cuniculi]QPC45967.1 YheE family protein [Mangrovibacillus cuniculi]
MFTHFQVKSLFENREIPGWSFSFFAQGEKVHGTYEKDGTINWGNEPRERSDAEKFVHEMMLFHVYEK